MERMEKSMPMKIISMKVKEMQRLAFSSREGASMMSEGGIPLPP
jgi:hypothetical protein